MHLLESIRYKLTKNLSYQKSVKAGFKPLDKRQFAKYNQFRPLGAKPHFCYLPFNSLNFSFKGNVYVCSYNKDILMGSYPQNSIQEIWEGEKAQKLRTHMLNNDLEYGCQHCKYFFDKGKFTNLRPLEFDKYHENINALHPKVFEFEIDNKCNLECQMCSGEISSSIRKNRDNLPPIPSPYDDEFVEQLAPYIPTLEEAKFYGGEPFMIPVYYKIWDKIKELNPELKLFVITNGTLWNKKIERLVNDLNFDIAISIDAMDKQILEKIRKNVVKETLIENIERFNRICQQKGNYLTLSFTIQQDNWTQLPAHIDFCNSMGAFAYISYLESPIQFSLLEFPEKKIEEIRNWLENYSFQNVSIYQKHNVKCFQDFKNYLDTYLGSTSKSRYQDYQPASKNTQQHQKVLIKSNVSREELFEKCQNYLNHNGDQFQDFNEIKTKLNQALAQFDDETQAKIIGVALESDISEMLNTISNNEVDEIVKSISEMLKVVTIEVR